MLLDYVRSVEAAKRFRLTDSFDFIGFDDLSDVRMPEPDKPMDLEVYAKIRIPWSGDPPESNRILNILIADWVDKNLNQLTKVIHENLKGHITEKHPGAEHEGLDQTEDTAVWTDQSEYMPDVDEDKKTMDVELELVLDAEPVEDE